MTLGVVAVGAALALVVWRGLRGRRAPTGLPLEPTYSPQACSPRDAEPSGAGPSLPGYRVLQKIGEGGSADVYQGISLKDPDGPPVALKIQREKEGGDGLASARFRQEIEASLRLAHPHLARVYDGGEDDRGRLFMASELLLGETLRERLWREPVLNAAEVMRILLPLGAALTYLHEHRMVHRDVKPDNIFLTSDGVVKLMDLGIIKSLEGAAMTQAGVVVGTPHYLAPEQIHGHSAPATDQYALAVTLFEMLAGTRPFRGSSMEIIEQHLYRPPPRLRKLLPDCSLSLDEALHKMMAKQVADRFPSLADAVEALCEGLSQGRDDDESPDTQVVVLR